MVTISRVRTAWSGWAGGPGVTTMFYAAPPTLSQLTGLRTFWDQLKAQIPTTISLQVENVGQQIETTTGQAVDTWATAPVTKVTGTGTGNMSAASGVLFRWNTGQFQNGRAVRGKTYLVPIVVSAFDPDGTISNAVLTGLQTIVDTFVTSTAGGLCVYSTAAHNAFIVNSGTAIDKQVVMRSRRT